MGFLKELGFDTIIDFLGFLTQILYNLTPILFNLNITYGSFEIQSISIISVFCLYVNAFIYFFLNLFSNENDGISLVLRDYCNLIGTFLGLSYLAIYYYEIYKDEDIKKMIFSYLLVILVSGLIILFEYSFIISNNNIIYNNLFKWIGVIPNVLEYLPIGYNIIYLIKNKISKSFLIIGSLFGLINSIIWLIWAVYTTAKNKDDPQYHSALANFLGICLCILQIYIFSKYRINDRKIYTSIGANKLD